jgi:hypothetical protein
VEVRLIVSREHCSKTVVVPCSKRGRTDHDGTSTTPPLALGGSPKWRSHIFDGLISGGRSNAISLKVDRIDHKMRNLVIYLALYYRSVMAPQSESSSAT